MSLEKWEEKMNEKKWDEMQKYREFNKENFKGVERFSKFFNKIFSFFRFSLLGICILVIFLVCLIYLGYVLDMKKMYVSSNDYHYASEYSVSGHVFSINN